MKNTKKIMALILSLLTLVSLIVIPANATEVGTIIGKAQPTDIVATINGYQLLSYNVDGYTYIAAEDLRYYGFNVRFSSSTRTLSVKRDKSSAIIDPQNTNPNFWNSGNDAKKNLLYTDIDTYVDNHYVNSYNIDGMTIIKFDELSRFGKVSYDNDRREISLYIEDMLYNPAALIAEELHDLYEYNEDWKVIIRAKGDVLELIGILRDSNLTEFKKDYFLKHNLIAEKADAQKILDLIKESNAPISSVYVEFREKNGNVITSFQIY